MDMESRIKAVAREMRQLELEIRRRCFMLAAASSPGLPDTGGMPQPARVAEGRERAVAAGRR